MTEPVWLVAPAKLTVSLRVVGRRPDGYHEIVSEMVSIDLADDLYIDADGSGFELVAEEGSRADGLSLGPDNIVAKALAAVGRTASVRLVKRIPVGGGLGGGSTDAAAILRWAGSSDNALAAGLGADVPFCVAGGRAMVRGIGERLSPMRYEDSSYVLLVPPISVNTGAVYEALDRGMHRVDAGPNDLAAPAIVVEPKLAHWRDVLGDVTGVEPFLAGSGSTWCVEGTAEQLGVAGRSSLVLGAEHARLIPVRTVRAGWSGNSA